MRQRAILLLILTATLWSSSGLFVKLISWEAPSILSARGAVAFAVLLIYLRSFPRTWTRDQVVGALAYLGSNLFFIAGTKLTAAANVIFLSFTSPVYLVLFGYWFLGEKPKRADLIAMIFIFTGMFLFLGDDLTLDGVRGNILGILAGISMAVMILCMRRQKTGTPANTVLLGNLFAIFIGLPWLIQETFTPANVGYIVFLGIFQIGLSFILYSFAIKHLEALESTLIVMLEPVLNPVWVFLVIGEMPGIFASVGGMLVLSAVVMRAVISAQEKTSIQIVGKRVG
ncbi:DMT family transporter [Chloroflexi bacterium TSY]|nr:DMT family transporter [Chloroflexi bacterium TSY]